MSAALSDHADIWTRSLPSGWRWERLSKMADVIVSNVDKKTEDNEVAVLLCNYVDVYKNDKITSGIEFMEASATLHEIDRFTIRRGDVLATKDSENPLDIAVPATVADDLEGVLCGYHLAIIRADNRHAYGPFLGWLHVSKTIRSHYEMHATGITRWAVGRKHFKTCPIPIPPFPEQKRIAAYLDASCAAIDRAVATKQQQLETLDALRKSIIQKAVTQGLNPEVEMKESGVDWLGPVPKHWRVRKLKRCGRLKGGAGFPHDEQGVADAEIPFYKVKHLQATRYLTDCDNFVSRETAKELGAEVMPPNTVVFAKVGAALLLNRFRVLTRPSCIDNNMMALQVERSALRMPYFFHMLNLLDVGKFANQGPVPSINGSQVGRIEVPVPPSDEQDGIVEFIEVQATRIDDLKALIESQIETLTAYRKSLIHECVTGQRRISEADVAKMEAPV